MGRAACAGCFYPAGAFRAVVSRPRNMVAPVASDLCLFKAFHGSGLETLLTGP